MPSTGDGESDLTDVLEQAKAGSRDALDRLLPAVYGELRRLAQRHLQHERPDHTLQATALVHEAYLRLINQDRVGWRNRTHFFAVAAQAIRRVLVDHARGRNRKKRGAEFQIFSLDDAPTSSSAEPNIEILALDRALEQLADAFPAQARVVELRVFGGLTKAEVAEVLGVGTTTVERYWEFSRV